MDKISNGQELLGRQLVQVIDSRSKPIVDIDFQRVMYSINAKEYIEACFVDENGDSIIRYHPLRVFAEVPITEIREASLGLMWRNRYQISIGESKKWQELIMALQGSRDPLFELTLSVYLDKASRETIFEALGFAISLIKSIDYEKERIIKVVYRRLTNDYGKDGYGDNDDAESEFCLYSLRADEIRGGILAAVPNLEEFIESQLLSVGQSVELRWANSCGLKEYRYNMTNISRAVTIIDKYRLSLPLFIEYLECLEKMIAEIGIATPRPHNNCPEEIEKLSDRRHLSLMVERMRKYVK